MKYSVAIAAASIWMMVSSPAVIAQSGQAMSGEHDYLNLMDVEADELATRSGRIELADNAIHDLTSFGPNGPEVVVRFRLDEASGPLTIDDMTGGAQATCQPGNIAYYKGRSIRIEGRSGGAKGKFWILG